MDLSQRDGNAVLHSNLSQWILQNGGKIHKSLALCMPNDIDGEQTATNSSSSTDNRMPHPDSSQRGIFAKHSSISKGEELIRLPQHLALDGRDLPVNYGEQKNASAWLRCLASLLQSWHIWDNVKSNGTVHLDQSKDNNLLNNYSQYGPYLDSLPETYDSLLNWSLWELRSFLAGTTLGIFALSGIKGVDAKEHDTDKEDNELETNMRTRYQTTVVPYLNYLKQIGFFALAEKDRDCNSFDTGKNDKSDLHSRAKRQKTESDHGTNAEDLYNLFRRGCMCISTRAFHMQSTSSSDTGDYQGPYLLPYIDLLNHAPTFSSKHVTTLRRDPHDGSFVMIAERDIEKGEEICHSYDSGGHDDIADVDGEDEDEINRSKLNANLSSLTSAQLLQTFGFVDVKGAIERLSHCLKEDKSLSTVNGSQPQTNLTPAIITKDEICQTCKDVSMSSYPNSLRRSMEEDGLVDDGWEYWDLPLMKDESTEGSNTATSRHTSLNGLPNDVIIPYENPLSDELITLFSLNFLPKEAIDDLFCSSSRNDNQQENSILLTEEVLDDYFLGKLVLHSMIQLVNKKLERYQVCFNDEPVECRTNMNGTLDIFLEFMRGMYKESAVDKAFSWGKSEAKDLNVLSTLVAAGSNSSQDDVTLHDLIKKFTYGMTISSEERCCLLQLKRVALDKLLQIDES
eukprot:CCRYP_019673-RA/>CCRYP_019673-RA protein AED:0.32 eAED:0.32 QI:0/-1/0/1/-1/1/1/0/680